MIEALISGKLFKKPVQRQSGSGKSFTTAMVRVACGEESVFTSVIAFDEAVQKALMALEAGDGVALSGSVKPKLYEGKDGVSASIDMVANGVLTAYSIKRKREGMAAEPKQAKASPQHQPKDQSRYGDFDLNDDMPM